MKKQLIFLVSVFCLLFTEIHAQDFVTDKNDAGNFPVVVQNNVAAICVDTDDYFLVNKAASFLRQDIQKVTDKNPEIINSFSSSNKNIIIIGSVEKSALIQELVKEKKLNTDSLRGKWEAYRLQVIRHPFKGVNNALVIVGSDRRGTAYGVFTLSQQMGVSPWYWWADVPVKKKKEVFVKNGTYNFGSPSVKYRGIFLNDEAPALSGWAREKFGNLNHLFYEKLFELLLRLKANYLWPAMWGNAFNNDDTLNPVLADEYGIVMGTSHQEPMNQATEHWRHLHKGAWDYTTNDSVLRDFWKQGIENMGHRETIVTLGMRGDGDEPMTQGTAINLLEKIVADQRKIIADVTHKPASETPQDWALYKEVQDYYDKGMRVPDDVTLLLSDDNWGNIRRLPKLTDKPRSGGYGIYYHFDYVGGPRNYKWLNTNNIARVWEQMHLAYEYNARQIWIVNVGDLKPMEFPISFFLDYAWNVKKWNEDNLPNYYEYWASEQFGKTYSKEIGSILERYSQYASRRKPELLDDKTYNLDEWNFVLRQWQNLLNDAEKINEQIPAEYKDAYFELVLHPVKAVENLHELYYDVAMNKEFALHNDNAANTYADKAKQAYINDSLISLQYNRLDNGKWNHMMDQTHIGYTYWQEPKKNSMPKVEYVEGNAVADSVINNTGFDISKIKPVPFAYPNAFEERDGCVSIEAAHYKKAVDTKNVQWKIIKDIGRDGDGITAFPVTQSFETLAASNPRLQYEIYVSDTGTVKLNAYFSPTLNFHNDSTGLQYAVSIDDEQPQIVSVNKDDSNVKMWSDWVANDIIIKTTQLHISTPGKHVVKYWMISNAVVLQKIVLNFGNEKYSYLGAQETRK